ncbi:MAG: endolytic transglycosylase MltG, partial [Treponema sp.]|nr:endolytic transglycosylase MltG [Treponema sp.]
MKPVVRLVVRIVSCLVALCLCLLVVGFGLLLYFNTPPGLPVLEEADGGLRLDEDGSVLIEVRKGETGFSVGKRLEEAGIIRSRYFWYALSRFGREFVKSGTFRLELPATQLAVRKTLVEGRQMLEKVVFPEGSTLKKTARILEEAGICAAEDLLRAAVDPDMLTLYAIPGPSMEGYLFPDTYLFPKDYSAELVIRSMADNFFSKVRELGISSKGEELHVLVTLASIVEREYRVEDEAPLMAGVFLNRLRIGMALQSCATVEYVITEIQGKPHPELIYTRDTEIRDPYNTYVYPGLPPGPICSPGTLAL